MPRRTAARAVVAAVAALGFAGAAGITTTAADPPAPGALFPAGGAAGTEFSFSAGGKLDPWLVEVWNDRPGLTFSPTEEKGRYTVRIAADVRPGPCLIRFFNAEGASAPRVFVVGRHPEVAEAEPKERSAKPQPVESLPVVVNGRLDPGGDVDGFAVELKRGQWLVAEAAAFAIDSPVDPLLHLFDPSGAEVAFNHDGPGGGLDPRLVFRAPEDGVYTVHLSGFGYPPKADVRLGGSPECVYRLALGAGPRLHYTYPSGLQAGRPNAIHLVGWNLGTTGRAMVRTVTPAAAGNYLLNDPAFENALQLPVGEAPELRELEPNDAPDLASPVPVPGNVTGRIDAPGDTDHFAFLAEKGAPYRLQLRAATLGSPLDGVLRLLDADGKQLARHDDTAKTQPDPVINWTAPAAGTFTAEVTDLPQRGGETYFYRLEVTRPEPRFSATALASEVRIAPGKTAEIKLAVNLHDGFTGRLTAWATGLPPGVTSQVAPVPEKGGEVTLVLAAAGDAKPANAPFRARVVAEAGGGGGGGTPDALQATDAVFPLKGRTTEAGRLLVDATPDLWVTVLEVAEKKDESEKKEAAK